MRLLIQNGRVVHPVTGTVLPQDILVEEGRVSLMEHGLDCEADRVIDASGLMAVRNSLQAPQGIPLPSPNSTLGGASLNAIILFITV